jgi:hypothetical protein
VLTNKSRIGIGFRGILAELDCRFRSGERIRGRRRAAKGKVSRSPATGTLPTDLETLSSQTVTAANGQAHGNRRIFASFEAKDGPWYAGTALPYDQAADFETIMQAGTGFSGICGLLWDQ